MNEKNSSKKIRSLNKFMHCKCGVTYISGYTHCPNCGIQNIRDLKPNESTSVPHKVDE